MKTTPAQKNESIEFVTALFHKVSGRAHTPLNGLIAGFDRTETAIFVKDNSGKSKTLSMPAGSFLNHITAEERQALEALPSWDGANEYRLSGTVLSACEAAIKRYHSN